MMIMAAKNRYFAFISTIDKKTASKTCNFTSAVPLIVTVNAASRLKTLAPEAASFTTEADSLMHCRQQQKIAFVSRIA